MDHLHAAPPRPAPQSAAEQNYVEQAFYTGYQMLLPFHGNYWIGAQIGKGKWPNFYWLDKTIPYDSAGYMSWGTYRLLNGATSPEPNNTPVPENCAVGNYSQLMGTPPRFGWADTFCGQKLPAICKKRRGCSSCAGQLSCHATPATAMRYAGLPRLRAAAGFGPGSEGS
jgi:hypothetical protein